MLVLQVYQRRCLVGSDVVFFRGIPHGILPSNRQVPEIKLEQLTVANTGCSSGSQVVVARYSSIFCGDPNHPVSGCFELRNKAEGCCDVCLFYWGSFDTSGVV